MSIEELLQLEGDAALANQKVAEAVEKIRPLLDMALVQKQDGSVYLISHIKAVAGQTYVEGYRVKKGEVGLRKINLGRLSTFTIIAYHNGPNGDMRKIPEPSPPEEAKPRRSTYSVARQNQ